MKGFLTRLKKWFKLYMKKYEDLYYIIDWEN
jgi:hypothetical protein